MDQKIAEYDGRKEQETLGGRTCVNVEESSGDAEPPKQKRPKMEGVEPNAAARAASSPLDTNALVSRLTDAISHAADEACRQAVTEDIKLKGMEGRLARLRRTTGSFGTRLCR